MRTDTLLASLPWTRTPFSSASYVGYISIGAQLTAKSVRFPTSARRCRYKTVRNVQCTGDKYLTRSGGLTTMTKVSRCKRFCDKNPDCNSFSLSLYEQGPPNNSILLGSCALYADKRPTEFYDGPDEVGNFCGWKKC